MNAEQGELITAGATTAQALTITNATDKFDIVFYIKVISGTIKIGKGSVNAAAHGFTGDIPPISCRNGQLYFQAASALDTFVVTVVE